MQVNAELDALLTSLFEYDISPLSPPPKKKLVFSRDRLGQIISSTAAAQVFLLQLCDDLQSNKQTQVLIRQTTLSVQTRSRARTISQTLFRSKYPAGSERGKSGKGGRQGRGERGGEKSRKKRWECTSRLMIQLNNHGSHHHFESASPVALLPKHARRFYTQIINPFPNV